MGDRFFGYLRKAIAVVSVRITPLPTPGLLQLARQKSGVKVVVF
jgi:hypothetical protein